MESVLVQIIADGETVAEWRGCPPSRGERVEVLRHVGGEPSNISGRVLARRFSVEPAVGRCVCVCVLEVGAES